MLDAESNELPQKPAAATIAATPVLGSKSMSPGHALFDPQPRAAFRKAMENNEVSALPLKITNPELAV